MKRRPPESRNGDSQAAKGGTDEGVRLPELFGGLIETGAQLDVSRASHEQAERNGLRVAIGELSVVRLGEEQLTPVGGQGREGRTLEVQLFGDLIAEQSTEAGRDLCQFLRACRRDRLRKKLSNKASNWGGASRVEPDVSTSPLRNTTGPSNWPLRIRLNWLPSV